MKAKFIFFIGFILLQSCAGPRDGAIVLQPDSQIVDSNSDDTPVAPETMIDDIETSGNGKTVELTYQNVLTLVLTNKCLNCHSEKGGNRGELNLEGYQNIFNIREKIREQVLSKKMPKRSAGSLTDEQMKLVVDWIDAGAKEFVDTREKPVIAPATEPPVAVPISSDPTEPEPTTPPKPDPVAVSTPPVGPVDVENLNFAGVMKLVIEPKCIKCHGTNAKNGVELVTLENLIFNKEDLKKDIESGIMPHRDTLADSQKKLIYDWIAAGMSEK